MATAVFEVLVVVAAAGEMALAEVMVAGHMSKALMIMACIGYTFKDI